MEKELCFAHLESRLRAHPAVRDVWIDVSRNVVHIVPRGPLLGPHPAEPMALEGGLTPILVDRLPLDDDGNVDLQALSQPEPDVPAPALHLDELLPGRRRDVAPAAREAVSARAVDDGDRPWALVRGPAGLIPEDAPANLVDALVSHARSERGASIGLTLVGQKGTSLHIPYAELYERARRVLGGLQAAGLRPGQVALLQLDSLEAWFETFWGCVLGGVVPATVDVPASFDGSNAGLNKLWGAYRVLERPPILAPRSLVSALAAFPSVYGEATTPSIHAWEDLRASPPAEPRIPAPEDTLFIQLTSGSTGVPKAIPERHRAVVAHVHSAGAHNAYSAEDVSLSWVPLDHVMGLLSAHLKDTYLGARQIQVATSYLLADPTRWLELIEARRVTVTAAPNFFYKLVADAIVKQPGRAWDLSSIRWLLNAGEQVTRPAVEAFLARAERFGVRRGVMQPAFGMAELASGVSYNRSFDVHDFVRVRRASLAGAIETASPGEDAVELADCGEVVPNMEVRIVDDDGNLLREGRIGRLQARAPTLMPGYLREPEANAAAFVGEGWFDTGDLGFLLHRRLVISGRRKETLSIRGNNIHCHEVESVVSAVEGVRATWVAACATQDRVSGAGGLAIFFVPTIDVDAGLLRAISAAVVSQCGVLPDRVLPIEAELFPRTTSGKIQRTRLAEELAAGRFDERIRAVDRLLRNEHTVPDWFFRWQWRPARGVATAAAPDGRVVVIPGREVTPELPDSVVVARFPEKETARAEGAQGIGGSSVDSTEDRAAWIDLFQSAGPIRAVVAGWTWESKAPIEPMLRMCTLLQGISPARLRVIVPTRHRLITGPRDPMIEDDNALVGLVRAISRSCDRLEIRLVDLDTWDDRALLAEVTDPRPEPEVAYRAGKRLVPRLVPARPTHTALLRPGLRLLITGGLGGVGSLLARHLLERWDARLVLLGRSPIEGEAQEVLRSLEAAGHVHYLQADCADSGAMRDACSCAAELLGGPLDGALHLAGSFPHRPLGEESASTLEDAIRPRRDGTRILHRFLPEGAFLMVISSVAASFGAASAGAYCAATRAAEWEAARARRDGRRVICPALSYVRDRGMSRGLVAEPGTGYRLIDPQLALTSFEVALHGDDLLVGLDADDARIRAFLEGPPRPAARRASHEPSSPSSPMEDLLARLWAEALGCDRVPLDETFFALGVQSVELVALAARLEKAVGRPITIATLFRHPTVRKLAAHLSGDGVRAAAPPVQARRSGAVAIIGMAGRFPQSDDLETFWGHIAEGRELVRSLTEAELDAAGVPHAVRRRPDFVARAGVLDRTEELDAELFGISPAEARDTDPQHRIFLETAWSALEDAAWDPASFPGSIGVFGGCDTNPRSNERLPSDPGRIKALIGSSRDYFATRVAYHLDLRGPAMTVQTACSTSLVAVHLAARALLDGACDMALAGGVGIEVPGPSGHVHQEGGILSASGHCRPFDASADGTVGGEGCGVVVLRRLDDALADGDPIRAVILGSAVNNDGFNKASYTSPSVEGQLDVIRRAQALSGISADSIGYVETHGTGTALGDPIELAALEEAFAGAKENGAALGAVKANIGHLLSAAGVAGLIKTVLVLEHGEIPPVAGLSRPSPRIDLARSRFRLPRVLSPWPRGETPRRASVSSFGFGGTNAHAVLEEAPPVERQFPSREEELLVVSARSPEALDAACLALTRWLDRAPEVPLASVGHTLRVGRRAFAFRRFVVCSDRAGAVVLRTAPVREAREKPRVAFLFPGQGSQHAGMCRGLYEDQPVFREVVDRCCDHLESASELRRVLAPEPSELDDAGAALGRTEVAQPALFIVEYALAKLWVSLGVTPSALLGHSVGEYVAATLAGVFSEEDALRLVVLRASLCQRLPGGGMIAVHLDEPSAARFPELEIAARNAPGVLVLSGPHAAIDAATATLTRERRAVRRIQTSHAFHSGMLDAMLPDFRAAVARARLRAPTRPILSNLTGTWLTEAQATDPEYWAQHLRRTVRFSDAVSALAAAPDWLFLEAGPGRSLSAFVARHPEIDRSRAIPSCRGPSEIGSDRGHLLRAAGSLWQSGVPLDFGALDRHRDRRRAHLPAYPFQRTSHPWRGGVEAKEPSSTTWQLAWRQAEPARGEGGRWRVLASEPAFVEALSQRARVVDDAVIDGLIVLADASMDPVRLAREVIRHSPPRLRLVTRDGAAVTGEERLDPMASALYAACAVLAQERGIDVRAVDLAGHVRPDRVAADLLAPGPLHAAWRGRSFWRRTVASARAEGRPAIPIAAGDGALILGTGPIALAMGEHLARACGASPAFVSLRGGDASALARIEALCRDGFAARVIAADLRDPGDIARVIAWAREGGPVRAVVHAAGAPMSPLSHTELTAASFHELRASKRPVVEHLATVLGDEVRCWLLTSSLSTYLGGVGLYAYAAVHAELEALAMSRDGDSARWLAIGWDSWQNGACDPRLAGGLVDQALSLDAPCVWISPTDVEDRLREAMIPRVRGAGPSRSIESTAPMVFSGSEREQAVARAWHEVLGVAVQSGDADFFAAGGDSLAAVKLHGLFRERLHAEIPLARLLAAPTVAAQAALLEDQAGKGGNGAGAKATRSGAPASALPASPPAYDDDVQRLYDAVSTRLDASELGEHAWFLNFGYVGPGRATHPEEGLNAHAKRLVLELTAGLTLTPQQTVLDVGCGRGGTVALLRASFDAGEIHGVDLSPVAIAFCRRRHACPRTYFHVADAQQLPFGDASFDVVVNVESSHGYPDHDAFLGQVARVLRPGGRFLFTDLLPVFRFARAAEVLARHGLDLTEDRDITANVLASCDANAERHARAFGPSQNPVDAHEQGYFLGLPGSPSYEAMKTGQSAYRMLRFERRG